jgi:glutamate formiminotransferase
MSSMKKIIECVPNFSEGRNPENIETIVAVFRGKKGIKLLDYQTDADHNRMVVTLIGEPDALKAAIIEAVGCAVYSD